MDEVLVILAYSLLGCLVGVVTGLIPGIHVNTLLPFMFLFSERVSGISLAALIISLAVTHTFLDFIPATIFGAPEGETALSVLPAHRMLLSGRGYEAIKLTAIGSLGALLFSLTLILPMFYLIPIIFRFINPYIGHILLLIVAFLILIEKKLKKIFYATFLFLLSGTLGFVVLSFHLLSEDHKLFAIFTGLFGLSILSLSVREKLRIPLQPIDGRIHLSKKSMALSILRGASAGMFVALFPGIGAAQATVLVQKLPEKKGNVVLQERNTREFLVSVSGVNTANAIYALVALYTISKPRSGAVIAIQNLVEVDRFLVFILICVVLFVAGIATLLNLLIARYAIRILSRFDYSKLCGAIMVLLILMVLGLAGFYGVLVCGVAFFIGIIPPLVGVRRSHCMGVLLLPVIIWYVF